MAVYPDGPQGIGRVLDTSFRLYRASFGKSVALGLISMFLVMAPLVLVMTIFIRTLGSPDAGTGMTVGGVLYAVCAIASMAVSLGIIHQIDARGSDAADTGLGDSIAVGFRRILPLIWTMIVWYIALLGSAIPAVAAGAFLTEINGLVGGLAAFILALLPIALMIYLLFGFVLNVTDRESGIKALRHSYALVKGNWWRVFLILTVITIIYMVLGIIATLLSGVITGALGFASEVGSGGTPLMFMGPTVLVATYLIPALFQAAIMPFMVAGLLATQHDLKMRKEGGDLEARLAQ